MNKAGHAPAPPQEGSPPIPAFAYYYPDTYWRDEASSSFVKSILLFFDGIATLVPRHVQDRAVNADPTLMGPLLDLGMMKMLDPSEIIDAPSVELMASALEDWLLREAKHLNSRDSSHWRSLSHTRLGSDAHPELFERTLELLSARGFARIGDGASAWIQGDVRAFILTAWSQILRDPGLRMGLDLNPVTDRYSYSSRSLEGNFERLLQNNRPTPSGSVITADLQALGIDLGAIPLDEVLDFRRAHQKQYFAYRHELDTFVAIVSAAPEDQARALFDNRNTELKEQAADLNRQIQLSFGLKSLGSFWLGLIGAAWGIKTGNIPGAAVGATAALWALTKEPTRPASLLYLASIRGELAN